MPWYVIYTKPRNEKKVTERLEKVGINVYCPLVTQIKQWSDRKKKVQVPLFNSYVFVEVSEKERDIVFQVTGVVRYLFWLGKPAVVRNDEIAALRESLKNNLSEVTVTSLQAGDLMHIPHGPFQGKEGIVKHVNKNSLQLVLRELGVLITLTKADIA
ncbi:UpxY family transcription antiterminator [Flavobacterium psychrotolerans]|uniref:Antitermination protein NusG n=1 Tax=Flavobacterium psychrotolerans TaxID=2169410 RepID=A0A2U1JIA9_9FLAO|nr:UpxY family transcription antiterminator [Flavobacterium psychrotolerans]PWA04872.1 antitermination protein NusG [Flavobacterium psychrotolerans]